MSDLCLHSKMITRESLAFNYDLVPPFWVWMIEGGQQQVKVACKSLHHSHLRRFCANNRRDHLCRFLVGIQPCWQRRIIQELEMALDPLRTPCVQILLDSGRSPLGLQTQRVATEVGRLVLT